MMSVPKKFVNAGNTSPASGVKAQQEFFDDNPETWEKVSTSGTIYKLSPGEWAIVKVVDMPRPIKQGRGYVVDVEVLRWSGQNPPPEGAKVPMVLQTVLHRAVENAIQKFGIPVVLYIKNLGKAGKNYYDFDVRAKPIAGDNK